MLYVFNKIENSSTHWIASQLIPSKLLIKHSTMVDDWNGAVKN